MSRVVITSDLFNRLCFVYISTVSLVYCLLVNCDNENLKLLNCHDRDFDVFDLGHLTEEQFGSLLQRNKYSKRFVPRCLFP